MVQIVAAQRLLRKHVVGGVLQTFPNSFGHGIRKTACVDAPHSAATFQSLSFKGNNMFKTIRTQATVAAVLVMAAALAPATSMAREGSSSRSVGKGIKCYTAAVPQADGTVKYQQVCYKGV
jgi:hypothetical protein